MDTEPQRLSDCGRRYRLCRPRRRRRSPRSGRPRPRASAGRSTGDLDTIVAKALKKDPAERYALRDRPGRGHSPLSRPRADQRPAGHARIPRRRSSCGGIGSAWRRQFSRPLAALAGTAAPSGRRARRESSATPRRFSSPARRPPTSSSASCSARRLPSGRRVLGERPARAGREDRSRSSLPTTTRLRAEMLAAIGHQHITAERFDKAAGCWSARRRSPKGPGTPHSE